MFHTQKHSLFGTDMGQNRKSGLELAMVAKTYLKFLFDRKKTKVKLKTLPANGVFQKCFRFHFVDNSQNL